QGLLLAPAGEKKERENSKPHSMHRHSSGTADVLVHLTRAIAFVALARAYAFVALARVRSALTSSASAIAAAPSQAAPLAGARPAVVHVYSGGARFAPPAALPVISLKFGSVPFASSSTSLVPSPSLSTFAALSSASTVFNVASSLLTRPRPIAALPN